jgi:hypothetical protein
MKNFLKHCLAFTCFAAASLGLGVVPAYSNGEGAYSVTHKVFCDHDSALAVAKIAEGGDLAGSNTLFGDHLRTGKCKMLPRSLMMQVKEIGEGPIGSAHGELFLVRVGDSIWTWAWPGKNSDIPASEGA